MVLQSAGYQRARAFRVLGSGILLCVSSFEGCVSVHAYTRNCKASRFMARACRPMDLVDKQVVSNFSPIAGLKEKNASLQVSVVSISNGHEHVHCIALRGLKCVLRSAHAT